MKHKIITIKDLKLELRYLIDSGIKSNMEMHIITPDANEHADAIMESLFFILINIGMIPINVANPDKEVSISGYNI